MKLRDRTGKKQSLSSHDIYLDESELDSLDHLADVAAEELTAAPKQQQQKRPSKGRNNRPRHVESDEEFSEDELEASGEEEEELQADLAGAWTEQERQDQTGMLKKLRKRSTASQYDPYIKNFKVWCMEHGLSDDLSSIADAPKAGRFFSAWCKGQWSPKGSRRKRNKLGPQGCMNVHAALVSWANICCVAQGKSSFQLRDDSGYCTLYKTLTQGRGANRKNLGAVQFTRDSHIKCCVELYGSAEPSAAVTRLLLTMKINTVSRGDEIRDVKLSTFAADSNDRIGPATCITMRFALTDHKVFSGKPEQKAFIRGRLPEACTMGPMGDVLHRRFKLDAEHLPNPGTAELEKLYLFPGKNAADPISYSQHCVLLEAIFEDCDLVLDKLTHVARVYGAQLLVAMGVDLQAVQRAGGWLQDSLGTAYIVCALCPQALLALAMWRADDSDMQCFADPRFFIAVPDELLYHALHALRAFEDATAELVAAAEGKDSKQAAMTAQGLAMVMRICLVARIQDAIATADKYPDNPFNADMLQHPLFKRYASEFKAVTDMGGFECAKPTSIRQSLRQMQEQLSQAGTISWYKPQAPAGISRPFVPSGPGSPTVPAARAAAGGQAMGTDAGDEEQQQQQPQSSPSASRQPQQQGTVPSVAQSPPLASQQQQNQQQQRMFPSPPASQQQQQGTQGPPFADQQQYAHSGGQRQVFLTPGGNAHTPDGLLGGYTPQGNHFRRFWHPGQQEPFGMQQPAVHNLQHGSADLLQMIVQQQSSTIQLLQQFTQQQQQQHSPGQSQLVSMLQQQHLLTQRLLEQQQQHQQEQQQQWGVYHESIWGGAGQQHMGSDPLAELIQPTINSNPYLAAAVGARGLAGGPSGMGRHNPAAALVQLISETVDQAVTRNLANHGHPAPAPVGPKGTGAAPSGPEGVGCQGAAAPAANAPPQVREVSKLSSWQSLPQMITWYTEERDVVATIQGSQSFYSRSELFEAGKPWCSQAFKQRASEYDAIFIYIRHHAVELTTATGRPTTLVQAAEDLAQTKGICKKKSEGGMSMYKFMTECEKFRKEQADARRAAAAAAKLAAADSGLEEQVVEEEEGVAS